MSGLTGERVGAALLEAGLRPVGPGVLDHLAVYGNLLLKWNERTNLTAVRGADGVLRRHLVESVAAAQALPAGIGTMLDFGTGAGLPGIPIALCRPEVAVTLAESQGKKVGFLREAVRSLGVPATIFAGRVDQMGDRRFGAVTMRAVDRMGAAIPEALDRVESGGWLVLFGTEASECGLVEVVRGRLGVVSPLRVPLPTVGSLIMFHVERTVSSIPPPSVPRGT